MIGQYTTAELLEMGHIVSDVAQWHSGICIRKVGHTVNYYRQESDGSWTNYDCKTIY